MASERPDRLELAAHVGVRDHREVLETETLGLAARVLVGEREGALDAGEDLRPGLRDDGRVGAEELPLLVGERAIGLRQDPLGLALEHVQAVDRRRDGGHQLHCARATPDHRHRLAGQVLRGVPLRRVHEQASERTEPGQVGPGAFVEHADRADEHLAGVRTGVGAHLPSCSSIVPRRARAPSRRSAGARAGRDGWRSPPDTRGSRAAPRTCATSRASGRTRTSRDVTGCRTPRRGMRCDATSRPRRPPVRGSRSPRNRPRAAWHRDRALPAPLPRSLFGARSHPVLRPRHGPYERNN